MSDLSCSTLRELLATIPVSNIHFLGEDSVIRKDTITVDEVNVLSQTTLDALFEAWTQLRSIMAQHETTLNKRWLKRTINQRKEILSRAWPRMPPMHRPDFELLRKGQQSKKTEFSTDDALQFPHINMEDLSQAKPLLFMLDSRSRNPPSIFTNADRDSIHIGLRFKKLVPKYIHGYTMYLNGEQTHETYGRLVSWEQDPQAILKCQSGAAPDPGMGLMILGIQRDVLQFLVRCSAAILHDIPIADLIGPQTESFAAPSTPQPRIASPATPSIISTVEHGSLAAHVLEAPYRAPDAYDFARLRSLVEAKCCEVQDHFLLIREDPGYFAELIREECGHTVEAILNRQYKPHSTPLSEDAWNIAISQVLLTAYREAFMWEAVSGLFHQLIVRYTEQKVNMQPGQVLPDAYVKASSCLEFLLNSVIFSCLQPLPDHMSAVPTFKTLMSHKPCGNGKYEFDMQEKPGTASCSIENCPWLASKKYFQLR